MHPVASEAPTDPFATSRSVFDALTLELGAEGAAGLGHAELEELLELRGMPGNGGYRNGCDPSLVTLRRHAEIHDRVSVTSWPVETMPILTVPMAGSSWSARL